MVESATIENTVTHEQSLALETAWQRYAELETNASAASKQYLTLRGSAIALAVVATLLAILTSQIDGGASPIREILRIGLILVPIISAIVSQNWCTGN
jgi:hypothetical protein